MIRRTVTWGAVAVALAAVPLPRAASAEPAPITQGRAQFLNDRYPEAYNILLPYRKTHAGTLEVDFMLGASACKIDFPGLPSWGRDLLMTLASSYQVDALTNTTIKARLRTCGSPLQPRRYAEASEAPGTMTTYSGQLPGFGGTFRPLPLDDAALERVKATGEYADENIQAETLRKREIRLRSGVGKAKAGAIKAPPSGVGKVQDDAIKVPPGLKLDSIMTMKRP